MKTCERCEKEKKLTDFYIHHSGALFKGICKDCYKRVKRAKTLVGKCKKTVISREVPYFKWIDHWKKKGE